MKRYRSHALFVTALLAIVSTASVSALCGDGTVQHLRFQPTWQTGGEDDEVLLGEVSRVLALDDKSILVLDRQLLCLYLFSERGELLETIALQGEGPGEVQSATDVLLMPDGTFGVIQPFPGKIVKRSRQGIPAGTYVPGGPEAAHGGFEVLVRGKRHDDRIALTGIGQTFAQGRLSQKRYLAVFGPDGSPLDTLVTKNTTLNMGALVLDETAIDFCWERWDFLPDGGLVIAPARDEYRLEFHAPDGTLIRSIKRAVPPLKRDDDGLARSRALLEAQGRFYPTPPRIVVAETEPAVVEVNVRGDKIWILTGRGRMPDTPGVMASYDIFDLKGDYLGQVLVHGDGDLRDDHLFLLADGRAVLVRGLRSAALASLGGEDDDTATAGDAQEEEPAPLELIVGELVP